MPWIIETALILVLGLGLALGLCEWVVNRRDSDSRHD